MPIAGSSSVGKSYSASTKVTIELTRRMSSSAPVGRGLGGSSQLLSAYSEPDGFLFNRLDRAICYPEHHFRFGVAITVRLQVHPGESRA